MITGVSVNRTRARAGSIGGDSVFVHIRKFQDMDVCLAGVGMQGRLLIIPIPSGITVPGDKAMPLT